MNSFFRDVHDQTKERSKSGLSGEAPGGRRCRSPVGRHPRPGGYPRTGATELLTRALRDDRFISIRYKAATALAPAATRWLSRHWRTRSSMSARRRPRPWGGSAGPRGRRIPPGRIQRPRFGREEKDNPGPDRYRPAGRRAGEKGRPEPGPQHPGGG